MRSDRLHLENWDRLRVIAALDIVALHLAGKHAFFGFGLPLFLMLSIALSVSKPEPATWRIFASRRVKHILVPWLFWSVVFCALQVLGAWLDGRALLAWAKWQMLFYGPDIHLWFLPFIVFANIVAHGLHRIARSSTGLALAAAAGAGLCLVPAPPLDWPFEQWAFSFASIPLGFAIGRAIALEQNLTRLRLVLLGVVGLFCASASGTVVLDGRAWPMALRFAGGVGLLVAAVLLPNRADRFTRRLTPLMLGVYILHPIVYLWIVKPLMCLVACNDIRWLRVALTFPATMGIVYGLRATRLRAVL